MVFSAIVDFKFSFSSAENSPIKWIAGWEVESSGMDAADYV